MVEISQRLKEAYESLYDMEIRLKEAEAIEKDRRAKVKLSIDALKQLVAEAMVEVDDAKNGIQTNMFSGGYDLTPGEAGIIEEAKEEAERRAAKISKEADVKVIFSPGDANVLEDSAAELALREEEEI